MVGIGPIAPSRSSTRSVGGNQPPSSTELPPSGTGPVVRDPAVPDARVRNFDDFYRAHRDEIGRALAFTLRDPSLGAEAVDEAMTKAYQRWGTLGSTGNPAGWVYTVGLRWALSWRRGRRRERNREALVAGHVGGAGVQGGAVGEDAPLVHQEQVGACRSR